MGFVENFKNSVKVERARIEGDATVYMPHIRVTTTPPQGGHEVISVIFAMDAHKEGIFANANPAAAFFNVTNKLKEQCEKLGGNAVVSTQFEYRVAVGKGWGSAKQVIEIFAYGTVIKDFNG